MAAAAFSLRHLKECRGKGKDSDGEGKGKHARGCNCGPTVYAVLAGEWLKIGHLVEGWRKDDLHPFEEQLADMRRKLTAGEPYRPVDPKLVWEWAEEWFAELYDVAEAGDISRLTYESYKGAYRNHLEPEFGDSPLAAITSDMVRRFIRSKIASGLSPRTANALVTPFSAMLTDALDAGLIPSNPCHQPRRARHGASRRRALLAEVTVERPKYLEPAEARALLAATPERYRDMVLAALSTGFRRGELIGLRWEDISWGDGRIELRAPAATTKGGQAEVLELPRGAAVLGPAGRAVEAAPSRGLRVPRPRGQPLGRRRPRSGVPTGRLQPGSSSSPGRAVARAAPHLRHDPPCGRDKRGRARSSHGPQAAQRDVALLTPARRRLRRCRGGARRGPERQPGINERQCHHRARPVASVARFPLGCRGSHDLIVSRGVAW